MLKEKIYTFPTWKNLRVDFGAIGDGDTDDTVAISHALNSITVSYGVLYIPPGTYRITSQLTLTSSLYIRLIGENATLKWDGADGGTMLYLNGVHYSRFGGLIFNGENKAAIAVDQSWDGQVSNFDTGNEYADITFKDVDIGIQAGALGHGAAESSILRCEFIRCGIGLITKNFNALDWFIWHSKFINCGVGVTNYNGAGNFHVFHSTFIGSLQTDIELGSGSYFSFRYNYSKQSRKFLVARFIGSNGCVTTIQGNTILEATDNAPIEFMNIGPLLLLDNTIVNREGQTVAVKQDVFSGDSFLNTDIVSIGNQFNIENPIQIRAGRLVSVDDEDSASVSASPSPQRPSPSFEVGQSIFEIVPGTATATIQKIIDEASRYLGKRPTIHFQPGTHYIESSLIIPERVDLQLVGDGYSSVLRKNNSTGPILILRGPSHTTLHDLYLWNPNGNCLRIENADQLGGQIFTEQLLLIGGSTNLLVDGLDHTLIECRNFQHSNSPSISVAVGGGTGAAANKLVSGRTNIFAGASSDSVLSYEVSNGAKLLAQDIWYESSQFPGFVKLTDSGTFTFFNAKVFSNIIDPDIPAFDIDNFNGNVAILGSLIRDRFEISGGEDTKFLALGQQVDNTGEYFINESGAAQAAAIATRIYSSGSVETPDKGVADIIENDVNLSAFLREMLAHARNEKPLPLYPKPFGVTDIFLYRIQVRCTGIGIEISK